MNWTCTKCSQKQWIQNENICYNLHKNMPRLHYFDKVWRKWKKAYMVTHIASIHEGKKPFSCSICNSTFSYKAAMEKHIESINEKKDHMSAPNVMLVLLKVMFWKNILYLFMRGTKITSVQFVGVIINGRIN